MLIQGNDEAAGKIRRHHAALAAGLFERANLLVAAARTGGSPDGPRDDFVAYLREEIVPHAAAEETTLYRRGAEIPELRPLLRAMILEHERLRALADALAAARESVELAAAGRAIAELFALHADKENDLLLPRLLEDPDVSIAELLHDMHRELEG